MNNTEQVKAALEETKTMRRIMMYIQLAMEAFSTLVAINPNVNRADLDGIDEFEANLEVLNEHVERLKGVQEALEARLEVLTDFGDNDDAEAEPEEDQAPISAEQDFTSANTEITDEDLARLLRHIAFRYPEPAFTGGQIVNRILENHAEDIGVYYVEDDGDGGEKLTPVTIFEIDDNKVILG